MSDSDIRVLSSRISHSLMRAAKLAIGNSPNLCQSRHVTAPATSHPIRLVEKITAVTERRFGVLIDRNDDRLHMRVAPAFARRLDADLR
jgi:hypothetical protein